MVEVAKVICEFLFKGFSVSELIEKSEKKKKAEIGRKVFELYRSLDEVQTNGLAIVVGFETELRSREPQLWWPYQEKMARQRVAIKDLGHALMDLHEELALVSPKLSKQLEPILAWKGGLLMHVQSALWSDQFSSYAPELIDRFLEGSAEARSLGPPNYFLPTELRFPKTTLERLSGEHIRDLETFINERQPRENLEAMEPLITQLHEDLLRHFSIEDILIRARVKNKSGGRDFF